MARSFNGTSDKASVALNLSSYSAITISFWLWWTTFANDDKLACEHTAAFTTNAGSFIIDPDGNSIGNGKFVFGPGYNGGRWTDTFTRPSGATWHHYLFTMDRANRLNAAWVDGVTQTLSTDNHGVLPNDNFANSTLFLMCRNNASLFGAGRLAEFAIWGGVKLGTVQAQSMTVGALPHTVWPSALVFYSPLWGADSPEPDYSGGQHSVTVSGATFKAHPQITAGFFRKQQLPDPIVVTSTATYRTLLGAGV